LGDHATPLVARGRPTSSIGATFKLPVRALAVSFLFLIPLAARAQSSPVFFDNTNNGDPDTLIGGWDLNWNGNFNIVGGLFQVATAGTLQTAGAWVGEISSTYGGNPQGTAYTLGVYSMSTGASTYGQLGTLLETLTGTTPAYNGAASGPIVATDFLSFSASSAPVTLLPGQDCWFVMSTQSGGEWIYENGTTAVAAGPGNITGDVLAPPDGLQYAYLTRPANPQFDTQFSLELSSSSSPLPAPVPLPASGWLMLSVASALGAMSRKRMPHKQHTSVGGLCLTERRRRPLQCSQHLFQSNDILTIYTRQQP